jgi:hypothetical protein
MRATTTATRTTVAAVMVATSERGASVIQLALEQDARLRVWTIAFSIPKNRRRRPTGEGREYPLADPTKRWDCKAPVTGRFGAENRSPIGQKETF